MNRLLILLILAVLSTNCTKRIYVPQSRTTTIIDTIIERVSDSSLVQAVFECDSLNKVRLKQINQLKGQQSSIQTNFNNDTLKVKHIYKTNYIDRIINKTDTITIVETKEITKPIPTIPTFFWWTFGITLFSIAYYVCKFFIKK